MCRIRRSMIPLRSCCKFMFAGETSYDKSYENQSDTVCHDNVFVYGGRMIPQDWLYPFDFSAFIQSEVSPRQSQNLQKTGRKGGHYIRHSVREIRNYIIPIPPAPPAGAAGCGSLIVDTTDSVVSSVDATLVAFWRALLVTFAGSRIPFSTISTYSSL